MEEQSSELPKNDTPHTEKSESPWKIVSIVFAFIAVTFIATILFFTLYYIPNREKKMSVSPTQITPTISQLQKVDTSNWKTYTDTLAGFSLQYPDTVLFDVDPKGATAPVMTVSVKKLSDIPEDLPSFMGRNDAIKLKERLQNKGESDITIGKLNGSVGWVLSRFEECSVTFERSLTFFPGEYRVIIGLIGDEQAIVTSMPEFFIKDHPPCPDPVWNRDDTLDFMGTLQAKKGKGAGQEWYDTFDAIVKTVQLIPTESTGPTNVPILTETPSADACEFGENGLCNVFSDIKNSVSTNTVQNILAYHETSSITCDPDGMAIAICDGVGKGVVKTGYSIGRNQSEGSIVTGETYLSSIGSYISSKGPFHYQGGKLSGDKAVFVFLNTQKSIFVVFLHRVGMTWRISTTLLGEDFSGEYSAVSESILQ